MQTCASSDRWVGDTNIIVRSAVTLQHTALTDPCFQLLSMLMIPRVAIAELDISVCVFRVADRKAQFASQTHAKRSAPAKA
jgi:hypothetical protein